MNIEIINFLKNFSYFEPFLINFKYFIDKRAQNSIWKTNNLKKFVQKDFSKTFVKNAEGEFQQNVINLLKLIFKENEDEDNFNYKSGLFSFIVFILIVQNDEETVEEFWRILNLEVSVSAWNILNFIFINSNYFQEKFLFDK